MPPPIAVRSKIAADLRPSATGPQSAHLWWWPAVATLQAASVPIAYAAAPWDGQTDESRYRLMPPRAGGIIAANKSVNAEVLPSQKCHFPRRVRTAT